MIRARSSLQVAGVLTLLVLALLVAGLAVAPAPPATAADDTDATPLTVRLTSIAPSTIPTHGPLTLSGTVINGSDRTWRDINVQPLTSTSPITDEATLAAQTASDPETYIGDRLTETSLFAQVGDLAPGQRVHFRIRVPRDKLEITGAPGVYWIGVHALGAPDGGTRDDRADGRARTFIPLLPKRAHASMSLVLPLRADVRRATDTSVARPGALAGELGTHGRLGRLLALADTAGVDPVTWLVDPGLLDAVDDVAHDNPDLGVDLASRTQGTSSPSPSANGGPSAAGLDDGDRTRAQQWLKSATGLFAGSRVLALPYGDTDVSAVSRKSPTLLRRARHLSDSVLAGLKVEADDAVAPPDGYLSPRAARALPAGTTVLLSDHGDTGRRPGRLDSGQQVLFADATASDGGPRPGHRLSALPVRQQLLATAALAAMRGQRRPVVVVLPSDWDPGPGWRHAHFFAGLDQRWLSLEPLPHPRGRLSHPLVLPRKARRAEISPENRLLAHEVAHEGDLLAGLVEADDDLGSTVRQRLRAAALAGVSYHARHHPVRSRSDLRDLATRIRTLLDSVTLTGTEFVTLSSGSGTLTVSLVNGIDQPIRVGVHATTDSPGISIDDAKPVKLAAGQRSTLRLHAHASAIGVHQVAVTPVTAERAPFGTPLTFSLRTSQVGQWFWVALIVVGALLVVLIARRVVLRVRSHQWRRTS